MKSRMVAKEIFCGDKTYLLISSRNASMALFPFGFGAVGGGDDDDFINGQ